MKIFYYTVVIGSLTELQRSNKALEIRSLSLAEYRWKFVIVIEVAEYIS